MDRQSNMEYIRSFTHNAKEARKTVEKPWTSKTVLQKVTA